MSGEAIVQRESIDVMFKTVSDDQKGITAGWAEVEEAVGLRGRRFYGAMDVDAHEYRVCVQLRDGDDPAAFGLERATLAGGRYARVRLEGEPPALYAQIAPAFERLAQRPDHDPSRPALEYYRRADVIDLLLPVR
jgi:hypothetical protein